MYLFTWHRIILFQILKLLGKYCFVARLIMLCENIKKKRILSLEVTSEEVHDGKILKKLVDNASANNNVKGILPDGMYDSNNNFRILSKNNIKPGIKTRSNSKVKSTNCHARNMSVLKQQTNLKRWERSVSYGYRWQKQYSLPSKEHLVNM